MMLPLLLLVYLILLLFPHSMFRNLHKNDVSAAATTPLRSSTAQQATMIMTNTTTTTTATLTNNVNHHQTTAGVSPSDLLSNLTIPKNKGGETAEKENGQNNHQEDLVHNKQPQKQHHHGANNTSSNSNNHGNHRDHGQGVRVVSFQFDYVKAELILACCILLIGLFKLIYHQFKYPQALMPESCCLIILGFILGLFFLWSDHSRDVTFLEFDSKVFFFFLLPPIILEAAYSLKDRAFIDNLGTILLYAVLGTVLNIALIGGSLVLLNSVGAFGDFRIAALDSLLFASLIAAVDPVAVLAIFQELGVNKMLYFMVFGESLLNDAVTVVCYNLVNEFKSLPAITGLDCLLGLAAFLCVSFGGLGIGFFFGVLSSVVTRFTIHARVVEPVVCFTMAYLSYLCSELFHFSGIIGVIACGLFQNHFTMSNLSAKSQISVHYITKVVSSISESLIFIILGVMLVNERSGFWDSIWNVHFAIWSLMLCIMARFLIVFGLTAVVNHFTGGVRYISFQEQVIMAYGGLRGAVSFSLAFMLPDTLQTKGTLLLATYVVILFTVFGQGCTIKFLVSCLHISLAKKEDGFRLFNEFTKGVAQHATQGIEEIIGSKDFSWARRFTELSRRHLRPLLLRDYVMEARSTYDRLLMIESEENFKATLRQVASQVSLSRRAPEVVEDMMADQPDDGQVPHSERGSLTIDIYDEMYDQKMHLKNRTSRQSQVSRQQTEREVQKLTENPLQIQALIQGHDKASYPDRNLVNEELRERRRSSATSALADWITNSELYDQSLDRIFQAAGDLTEERECRNVFGGSHLEKKMSVSKGVLAMAGPVLGVTGSAYRGVGLGAFQHHALWPLLHHLSFKRPQGGGGGSRRGDHPWTGALCRRHTTQAMALQPGGRRRSLIGQQWTTALHHNLSPSNYYAALVNNGQAVPTRDEAGGGQQRSRRTTTGSGGGNRRHRRAVVSTSAGDPLGGSTISSPPPPPRPTAPKPVFSVESPPPTRGTPPPPSMPSLPETIPLIDDHEGEEEGLL